MKAIVFRGIGEIALDDVKDPALEQPTDALVRLTASAICGTDLHMIRGTLPGMKKGTILGHEGVGVVEEVGRAVRNFRKGDRVVIPSTISCGVCSYCRAGDTSQCDRANPNGPAAGTCFFGGPASSGPIDGLQAELARVPFAASTLVRLPEELDDDTAILLSDIFPTGYFAAELAEVGPGDTVAVFGCGPVGMFAIISAQLLGAGRILAIDDNPSRLERARILGAETVHFGEEHPVATVLELTGGIGVDRAIDAVGVDANCAHDGPAAKEARAEKQQREEELARVAPEQRPDGDNWHPGDAPSQVLTWAVQALAKAGTLGIVGVYPPELRTFPIGAAMAKNLAVRTGNCPHRRLIPRLIELCRSGTVDPLAVLSQRQPLVSAVEAYRAFDRREPRWLKVELLPTLQ